MAKYRYKDGTMFDNEKEASDFVCIKHVHCDSCPFYDYVHKRASYCTDDIAEEAFSKLYGDCGFEKVEEEEEIEEITESENPTSRLAEVLGVEEDQEWTLANNPDVFYRIHEGERQWRREPSKAWEYCAQEVILANLINNPDLIQPVSKTQWTEREIEIAKAWKTMNPSMTYFIANALNNAEIEIDGIPLTEDPTKCPNFFSCNNKGIKVSDILGES